MNSWLTLVPVALEPMSMVGGVPMTVTVSLPAVSGSSSTLSRRVRSAATSMAARPKGR